MSSFKDARERQWLLQLNVSNIRAIREKHKVDLASLEGKAFDQLEADPVLLVDVLHTLCEEQIEKEKITPAEFGESLVGDAIDNATAAMLQAIADFFPKSKREMVQTLARKTQAMREVGLQKAMAKIESPELEAKVMEAMDQRLEADVQEILSQLKNASASPASSASSPTA
jgi:chorismate mutase